MNTEKNKEKIASIQVKNLRLSFGGTVSLENVSLDVRKGEILAIIGPNGAGKTCLFNCINGFYRPDSGQIIYKQENLTRLSPHRIAKMGIARTFQNIELFTGLTTLDNLMAARHINMKRGSLMGGLFFGPARREEVEHRRVVEEIIYLLGMESIRKKIVGSLPYGQRKLVDLGRALCMEPEILLLDEPMAGMNLEEREDMTRFILDIFGLKGTCVVLVEHDMAVVMDIADRIVALEFGLKIADGKPDHIKDDPQVIKAYLGEKFVQKGLAEKGL